METIVPARLPHLLALILMLLAAEIAGTVRAVGFGGLARFDGVQPLSTVAIHLASRALDISTAIKGSPKLLGLQNGDTEWVNVEIRSSNPSSDDWVGVFSPAKFKAWLGLIRLLLFLPLTLLFLPQSFNGEHYILKQRVPEIEYFDFSLGNTSVASKSASVPPFRR